MPKVPILGAKIAALAILVISLSLLSCAARQGEMSAGMANDTSGGKTGAALFKQRCASCHPNGGNVFKAEKTLHKGALSSNNLANTDALVKYMRKPGQGMPKFNERSLPDPQARKIAEYVLKTF